MLGRTSTRANGANPIRISPLHWEGAQAVLSLPAGARLGFDEVDQPLGQASGSPAARFRMRSCKRRFQPMFEALVSRWVAGKIHAPGLEPRDVFRQRAEDALAGIRESQGRRLRVVAFTSGGPLGVAMQVCLPEPAMATQEVTWRVRNTLLTYSGPRDSLDGSNLLPHVSDAPELVAIR